MLYFPSLFRKACLKGEKMEGFAKRMCGCNHYRLKTDPNNKGKLIADPEARLEEELVVRPTSEAIIWNTTRIGFRVIGFTNVW